MDAEIMRLLTEGSQGWQRIEAALLAVVEVHRPRWSAMDDAVLYCTDCRSEAGGPVLYPCPTTAAIADALGVGR